MKKCVLFTAIAVGAMMVSCNKASETTEPEKEAIEATASSEMAALRTADALAKYGYEAESASALIEAANILASTPTQTFEAEDFFAGENNVTGDKKESQEHVTPTKLITDAKALTDDATLLAMAAKVEEKIAAADAEGTRGAVGGPRSGYGTVYAGDYTMYDVKFFANSLAEVLVSGDGDTDLDLFVYDGNGNLITSDTDYTDDCYVRFIPYYTTVFHIKIVNRGRVYNNYAIATN